MKKVLLVLACLVMGFVLIAFFRALRYNARDAEATRVAFDAYVASLPEGWVVHTGDGFSIALPERWEPADVTKEEIESALEALEELDAEWAQSVVDQYSSKEIHKAIKFWARDQVGTDYAALQIHLHQSSRPPQLSYRAGDGFAHIKAQIEALESQYTRLGCEVISFKSDMMINGLDAGWISMRLPAVSVTIRQEQYFFLHERDLWVLDIIVDETAWETYEPIFAQIARSFRLR